MKQIKIIIEKSSNHYSAFAENLEGIYGSGDSVVEAKNSTIEAIKLYKKVGFEEEGVMRKYTYLKSEGRFLDELLMSYIKISQ